MSKRRLRSVVALGCALGAFPAFAGCGGGAADFPDGEARAPDDRGRDATGDDAAGETHDVPGEDAPGETTDTADDEAPDVPLDVLPDDAGDGPPTCPDGTCGAGESCAACPADCGACFCGNGTCDPGESGCTCAADCPCAGDCDYSGPVDDARPLVLYYGVLKTEEDTSTGECSGDVDLPLNNRLFAEAEGGTGITDTMDVVFGGTGSGVFTRSQGNHATCTPPSDPLSTFKALGARVSYGFSEGRLRCCLLGPDTHCTDPDQVCSAATGYGVDATAAVIENLVRDGFDYVTVDEIKDFGSNCEGPTHWWRDDEDAGDALLPLLDRLNADGFNRRMIFWFEYKTSEVYLDRDRNGRLGNYARLLDKCRTTCRKMVFELYGSDGRCSADAMYLTTENVVRHGAAAFIDDFAVRLDRISSGVNAVSLAGIGIGPAYLDEDACDLAPLFDMTCPATGGDGSLHIIFSWMHGHGELQRQWLGAGFYKLCGLQLSSRLAPYERTQFADALRRLTSWWH